MIIESLCNKIFDLIYLVIGVFDVPPLPDETLNYLETATSLFQNGINLLNVFMPMNYMLICLGIIIGIDVAVMIYKLVMWIIRKIPMLNIS